MCNVGQFCGKCIGDAVKRGRDEMPWSIITSGKYSGKGLTLPQILFRDPDWFFWCIENTVFYGRIAVEAADLNQKARAIRIPSHLGQNAEAEYFIHRPTGRFGGVCVVPPTQPLHTGSSRAWRNPVFDMSLPRAIAPYEGISCTSRFLKNTCLATPSAE